MESLIKWNSQYSVGIPQIDEEHKKLVNILNKLCAAVKSAEADNTVKTVIDELLDYTAYHFKTEEELLKKHNYPDYENHKASHDKFTKNILEYKQQYALVKQYSASPVLEYLKNWLITHILATDKEYSDFLVKQGVS